MSETQRFKGMGSSGLALSDSSLKANAVLQNRYRIVGVIGGGGMGTVYQARDTMFTDAKRLVAIKEMQTMTADPSIRQVMLRTFQREANILVELSHPAIPKIFDFFVISDRAYLIMEYINGHDLEALLNKGIEMSVEKVIEWGIELCDVMEYLHTQIEAPIVFRDMKPSNVMIDSLGRVRLIDFGIAKAFVEGKNIKDTLIGTEGYSAPEQYKGRSTPLSDIYGLGATLHHLLTRKDPRLEPPFTFHERPIVNFNPKVPPRFIAIIEKAVSKDEIDRYQSCAEMKAALKELTGYRPSSAIGVIGSLESGMHENGSGVQMTSFFDDVELNASVQPKWTFETEDEIRASPTAYRELALVGSYDTNVWALKLENGEQVWKYPTKGGIATAPAVDETNKTVAFGSEDFSFYAIDYRTGRVSWTYQTKDRIRSSPRIAHEHIFFGSDDGKIYALSAINGRLLWTFDTASPVRSRPFVTNELVIAATQAGEIFGLSLAGNRKWSQRTRGDVIASPYVDTGDNICYIGSADTHMYAMDANSGSIAWKFRTGGPIIATATGQKGFIYFGSTDGFLYAVNAQTAREKWKFTATGKPIVGSPLFHKGAVYFGGTDEFFYCIDADSGKERWKYKTKGAITSAPTIVGDLILVGSMDHTLYAFPLVG